MTPDPTATADDAAHHVRWLNRLTYGAHADSLAQLQALGRAAYLDQQLAPTAAPPSVSAAMLDTLRRRHTERTAANALPPGDEKAAALDRLKAEHTQHLRQAQQRQLQRAIGSPQQVHAKMAWFWFNHFNVYAYKGEIAIMLADYQNALEPHLLGHFADLLWASVRHPAMMVYLDNHQSRAGRINENYARELMELHTLGIDGGYTQADVQALARILTGLQVNVSGQPPRLTPDQQADYRLDGAFEFNPAQHDHQPKTWLGQPVPGQGWAEVEYAIHTLAHHPSTAQFVAHRLCQFWVADQPPPALVARAAHTFAHTQGHIGSVLRTIIESDDFNAALGGQFKPPYHYAVSAARALQLDPHTLPPTLQRLPDQLGQSQFTHETPDGQPLHTHPWASSGQLVSRLQAAQTLARHWAQQAATQPRTAPPWQAHLPALAPQTRDLIEAEPEPEGRTLLLLASPDFMYH